MSWGHWGSRTSAIAQIDRYPNESYLRYAHRLSSAGFSVDMINVLWERQTGFPMNYNHSAQKVVEELIDNFKTKQEEKTIHAVRFYTRGVNE